MRLTSALPFALTSVAAILSLAAWALQRERAHLLSEFEATERNAAHELALAFEKEFRVIDEDMRLVATLIERTRARSAPDPAQRESSLEAGFEALATVVRHYRTLGMFTADGRSVTALDPTEHGGVAAQTLVARTEDAARRCRHARAALMEGPVDAGDGRQFYFYATLLPDDSVVVIGSEARLFFQALLRPREGLSAPYAWGPSGWLWSGCKTLDSCRAQPPSAWRTRGALAQLANVSADGGATWTDESLARQLGIRSRTAVRAWAHASAFGGETWTVGVVASSGALDAQELALWRRTLLATAVSVLSLTIVAATLVSHQRRAVRLQERLRHAQEVSALQDQLVRAEKLATVGVLTAGLAHEIGTPLMIIRGRAEALLERPLEDALAADLRSVLRQIDQISGVIGRVLDFSRAQPVEVRPTDAVAAARAAGELLGWRFRAKALGFDVEVADEAPLPPIAADPDQLQQVFVNLLLNACDASSPKQRIVVRLAAAGARARIEVVDEGCGVAPEQLNAIFDPFFTTKKRGEGTGLGLPVVASIVRNHGAEIAVASAPGAGTTVTLSWPVAKPAGAAVA